jgi:5-methylcytosine-specific restriction enzyme subunit McrC
VSSSSIRERSITVTEWEARDPDSHPELKGLFIETDDYTKATLQELSRKKFLSVQPLQAGLALKTYSYVGYVSVGGLKIIVRPKIEGRQLFHLLRYAAGMRQLQTYPLTAIAVQEFGLQDLLILQLIEEVTELMLRGLHRTYVAIEEDLGRPRGRINFQRIAHQAGFKKATLPCTYHPRLTDCLINQVLLSGLYLAIGVSQEANLTSQLRRLAARLQDQVSLITLSAHVLRRLDRESSRLVAAYRPSLEIICMLRESLGVSFEGKTAKYQLPGFLFDMNRFFQSLLSRFLKENLKHVAIIEENRLKEMMVYLPSHNPKGLQAPMLRPDFIVRRGQKIVAILDAKYRDLWAKPLPRSMLYQLGMYALSQPIGTSAAILYPTTSPSACEQVIAIRDSDPATAGHRAYVILRPVYLDKLERLILSSNEPTIEKTKFAHELAFGISHQA